MRIGLVGYFGHHNLGDEMFVAVWKQFLAGHQVTVFTPAESTSNFDAFILGGGNLFLENNFYKPFWPEQIFHKPVYAYGLGVRGAGKLNGEAIKQQVDLLKRCRYVSARDTQSRLRLGTYGVPNVQAVEDMGWAYRIPPLRPHTSTEKTLGFSFGYNMVPADEIENLLNYVARRGWCARFIPLQPGGHEQPDDHAPHCRLAAQYTFDHWLVPAYFDLEHRAAACGWCSIYAGSRFHGLMCALRTETPIIPLIRADLKHQGLLTKVGLPGDYTATTAKQFRERLAAIDQHPWDTVWTKAHELEVRAVEDLTRFVAEFFPAEKKRGPGGHS